MNSNILTCKNVLANAASQIAVVDTAPAEEMLV